MHPDLLQPTKTQNSAPTMKKPSLEFLMLTLFATAFFIGYLFENKTVKNTITDSKIEKRADKSNTDTKISGHVYKLSDQLHLAVLPLEESGIPVSKEYLKNRFPKPKTLDFLLGDIFFYTPGNNQIKSLTPPQYLVHDENIVQIVAIEPWNQERQATMPEAGKDARVFWRDYIATNKQVAPEIFWGMECYSPNGVKNGWRGKECLAERAPGEWAIFTIHANGENTILHPTISTRYFTPKYGGLNIHWASNLKNAYQWKEIDEKMWKLIESWNIAN